MEKNNQKTNDELFKLAKRRVFLKKTIRWHLIIYFIINAFLCAIYYLTTPSGYFWPFWSILGWGIGLIIHVVLIGIVLSSTNNKQDSVDKEYRKLLRDFEQKND